ncbi:hypothetical protein AALO_G00086090 [Alosa alosa]|uniref:Uncharacterized protein n=2 Tax=Alosa alosa TaxID=278164 RepID=A0AAV6H480_9TELE|nr:uncharacterized protein LOC125296715 isoform X2 [Alosa alosa]XP_048102741.1 uncharacterized protein LOC125296715 isoform X2 [Alosa alosa]KAG5280196.1 hypothetical protein AALO_G00086090 [Alosa alosa]
MEDFLDKLDEETSDIASQRKTIALRGLPIFIREDTSKFFLKCLMLKRTFCHSMSGSSVQMCVARIDVKLLLETDPANAVVQGVSVGILTVYKDDDASTSPTVRDVAVVLEGCIILHDLPDLQTAFAYLFGLLYAINIEYPKLLKYTFEAIQTIFFELGSRCSRRIRSLKTKLLH